MNQRKLTEGAKKKIAAKQFFKCNNRPELELIGIGNYECPLWKKQDENRGIFDESGYDIDHIIEWCITHDDSIANLQALCKSCHSVKTRNFMINNNNELKKTDIVNNLDILSKIEKSKNYKFYNIYLQFFDKCYKQIRFDDYDFWISVGMALKNIYDMDAFELFNYFSSKSQKYGGVSKTLKKYITFETNNNNCKGIGTLHKFARSDNLEKYKKIIYNCDISFQETDFAEMIYEIAGDNFVYIKLEESIYQLYCYNGKYWEKDNILLRKFISNELYKHCEKLINTVYINHQNVNKLKTQISGLKRLNTKQNIIETYKEFGVKYIDFDSKWWLLGFNDKVLDLKIHEFREYNKCDYISITTGYCWNEPTEEQLSTLKNIIRKIMPLKDERQLYKQILSTTLEGQCLEKFIIFNGDGRNGKGLIDDLLLHALGNYGISANNSILFEKNKTGSNPEKANLHKKRFILFKEPASKNKFENSVVKELTGGGKFSARTHNEKTTEKVLHNTTICECNKRPLFSEEPMIAEVNRIIDVLFRSTFTENKEDLNDEEYIYEAKKEYKDIIFQESHKYALIQILMNAHKKYAENNSVFVIPNTIKKRTSKYLEASCFLLNWFKDNYELTNDINNYISIKKIYDEFKFSDHYINSPAIEKRKMNYKYFAEYFTKNILTKKYYKGEYHIKINDKEQKHIRKVLLYWKEKIQENDINDIDN